MGDFSVAGFVASLVVSSVGFVLLSYGRKMSRLPHALAGIFMLVYPYFISEVWIMLLVAAVPLGFLFLAVRLGW